MTGEKIIEIIEETLSDSLSPEEGILKLKKFKSKEGNKINCAIRLLKAYKDMSYYDFCGHLRQVIVFYGYPIKIENKVFKQFVINNLSSFGLSTIGEKNNIKFSANYKILPGTNLECEYKYENRIKEDVSIGDGRLYTYTGYSTYRTFSQKMLLNKISKCEYGDTLLASLPTGAGKSLSWQLPGISNEYPGLIIVIVPTTALAINHENASKKLFERLDSGDIYPKAYYSGISKEKKDLIKKEIQDGVLPILYISPEALMYEDFKEMIFDASKDNKISMLVVDEAHLIVNWGGGFRPEFQLIPSFRNAINEICKIKTILLSATLTDNDLYMIKKLFANEDNFIEFHADSLRPEITYKLDSFNNSTDRLDCLKKLILQVPRPVIIYSATILSAENILNEIKNIGLRNVELFTSQTSNKEEILRKFVNDDIDIIVATSAFGMGVDKSDIRTIIHPFIPENISRYYQEAGRAGRDGYSALDFTLITLKEDKRDVNNLISNSILRTSSIVDRWISLSSNSSVIDGDSMWVDMHIKPRHLQNDVTGEQNASWNKFIIMFLYRNGFIDILDASLKNKNDYLIKIRLLKRECLSNPQKLLEKLEDYREEERNRVVEDFNNSLEMLRGNNCYGAMLKNEYKYVEEICSGCPYCDKHKEMPYYSKSNLKILSKDTIINRNNSYIETKIKYNKESLLTCDNYTFNYGKFMAYLIKLGVHNFVIPNLDKNNMEEIYKEISHFRNISDILIIDKKEFMEYNLSTLISHPIAIVLDSDMKYLNKVFKFADKYTKTEGDNIVFVSKEDVVDKRFNKEIINTEKFPLGKIEKILGGRNENF